MAAAVVRHSAAKAFHVSPFMDMDQDYHFELTHPGGDISVVIRQTDADGPIFTAAFTGNNDEMTDASLLRAFFRYKLMTLKVIVAIHVEAAKLFAKGMRPRKGVPDPAERISVAPRKASRHAA